MLGLQLPGADRKITDADQRGVNDITDAMQSLSYLLVNVLSPTLEAIFFGARFWRLSNSNSKSESNTGATTSTTTTTSSSQASGVLALAAYVVLSNLFVQKVVGG